MALIKIGRSSRDALRINRVSIATVGEGGTYVNADDPAVRRDLNLTMGRWEILSSETPQIDPSVENSFITVGVESGNEIYVSLTMRDRVGLDLVAPRAVQAWLSDNADGSGVATTPPTTITADTGLIVDPAGTLKAFTLVSDSSGLMEMTFAHSSNIAPLYLAVVLPDGSLLVSEAIDFA